MGVGRYKSISRRFVFEVHLKFEIVDPDGPVEYCVESFFCFLCFLSLLVNLRFQFDPYTFVPGNFKFSTDGEMKTLLCGVEPVDTDRIESYIFDECRQFNAEVMEEVV